MEKEEGTGDDINEFSNNVEQMMCVWKGRVVRRWEGEKCCVLAPACFKPKVRLERTR